MLIGWEYKHCSNNIAKPESIGILVHCKYYSLSNNINYGCQLKIIVQNESYAGKHYYTNHYTYLWCVCFEKNRFSCQRLDETKTNKYNFISPCVSFHTTKPFTQGHFLSVDASKDKMNDVLTQSPASFLLLYSVSVVRWYFN